MSGTHFPNALTSLSSKSSKPTELDLCIHDKLEIWESLRNWKHHAQGPAFLLVQLPQCDSRVTVALGAPRPLSVGKLSDISTTRKDLNLWALLSCAFTLLFTLFFVDSPQAMAKRASQQLQTYFLPGLQPEQETFSQAGFSLADLSHTSTPKQSL